MKIDTVARQLKECALLLRWNKPSGRMILLIPAGWSLWLTPNAPPEEKLLALIIAGGVFVSGVGCIANDLWDRHIDQKVSRTKNRPLAKGTIRSSTAFGLLVLLLLLSLLIVFSLPTASTKLCLSMALLALPIILIYPSAKRWFAFPQAILAICWGFAVLIPWAASESSLLGGIPLLCCWLATVLWTFGFDTVYAMADRNDDKRLGINSSALSLGSNSKMVVAISYALTSIFIATSANNAEVGWIFWPIWLIATIGMQLEISTLDVSRFSTSTFGRHFKNQAWLGALTLLGLVLGRL